MDLRIVRLELEAGLVDNALAIRAFADKVMSAIVCHKRGKVAKILVRVAGPFAYVARLMNLLQVLKQRVVIKKVQAAKFAHRVRIFHVRFQFG